MNIPLPSLKRTEYEANSWRCLKLTFFCDPDRGASVPTAIIIAKIKTFLFTSALERNYEAIDLWMVVGLPDSKTLSRTIQLINMDFSQKTKHGKNEVLERSYLSHVIVYGLCARQKICVTKYDSKQELFLFIFKAFRRLGK